MFVLEAFGHQQQLPGARESLSSGSLGIGVSILLPCLPASLPPRTPTRPKRR